MQKHFLELVITGRCSFLHLESMYFRKQFLETLSWEYCIFWPMLQYESLAL